MHSINKFKPSFFFLTIYLPIILKCNFYLIFKNKFYTIKKSLTELKLGNTYDEKTSSS